MKSREYIELKQFLNEKIYPQFGKQPSRFSRWNKHALRVLYVDFLKPHYQYMRNNPRLFRLLDEVERYMECE